MWKCKECGGETFYVEGLMDFPNLDKKGAIQNYSDFEPRVYICLECGIEKDTIQELADWTEN